MFTELKYLDGDGNDILLRIGNDIDPCRIPHGFSTLIYGDCLITQCGDVTSSKHLLFHFRNFSGSLPSDLYGSRLNNVRAKTCSNERIVRFDKSFKMKHDRYSFFG